MSPGGIERLLAWAPLASASAHILEEFVVPGGFAEWYRRYRPETAASFTPRFAALVNGALLAVCLALPFVGGPRGVALWLTIAALLCANGCFHVLATLRMREYSPGTATGLLLYVPLAVAGFVHLVSSGAASVGTALSAAALGASYNLITAWNHRRRAAARAAL